MVKLIKDMFKKLHFYHKKRMFRSSLIIDSNSQESKEFAKVLKDIGIEEVKCAKTGEKGFEITRRYKPDLILVDLFLSDCEGDEVVEKIRNLKSLKTKIIMFTNFPHAHEVRFPGADLFLYKTANPLVLSGAVDMLN